MGFRFAQMLQSPDSILRKNLRLSSGPFGYDTELFSAAYVATEPEGLSGSTATLTTSHNRIQVINPGSNRIILLPDAGIRSGEILTIVNRSGNHVTIRAADASNIDIIDLGYIKLIALADNPAGNTEWYVFDVYEEYSLDTDIDNLFGTDPTVTLSLVRSNGSVSYTFTDTSTNTKSGTGNPTTLTASADRFRPTLNLVACTFVMDNGVWQPGALEIRGDGTFVWYNSTLSTWTSGANARISRAVGAYPLI